MIPELEAEILRLHHVEKWPVGTIALQLGCHHSAVRRVIDQDGERPRRMKRRRMIDPFVPFIVETFSKYPRLTASRLYDMCRERGYQGKQSQFRALISEFRPRQHAEAYLRLRTLAAEESQVDWGHFGRLQIGRASRPLVAFVMVLSYSRAVFLRFFLSQNLSSFLHGHQMAFAFFGGVSRRCLYDNLRSAVLERNGRAVRFNPQFLHFSAHYRFEARPVAPARGNEKGRVERAIRFVRDRFMAARRFKNLDNLNRQALKWCQTVALERKWPEDSRRTVAEVFEEEKQKLTALPRDSYPTHERLEVSVGKSPYVRFDLNDYSVPHTLVRKTLVVLASLDRVRILDGNKVVAEHQRSWDRGQQIEDPRHVESLAHAKAAAGSSRRKDVLAEAVPSSAELMKRIAERGLPLGRATGELLELLRTYGAAELDAAITEAIRNSAPHPQAVRHILERNRKEAGTRPTLPLPLPEDPRLGDLFVKPHDLSTYESLEDPDANSEDQDRDA
jgi:transposase